MEFTQLLHIRQSVRHYDSRNVEKEKVMKCIEAARLAPSASNSQPWSFIVVDHPVLKDQVARATFDNVLTFNKFTLEAPVVIVIVMEPPRLITQIGERIKNKEWVLIDIGIAAEHLCLQAAELGLGTCMVGWYQEKKLKEILHIPAGKSIGLLISLGYPATDYPLRKKIRKDINAICRFNSYRVEP